MATLYPDADLSPSKLELITGWIGKQRWYAARGLPPQLTIVGRFRFEDPAGEVGMETFLVRDDAGAAGGAPADDPTIYQVPFTYRAAPLEGGEHALVGTMEHSVLGPRWVYDAPHDPVWATALLAVLLERDRVHSASVPDALEHEVRATREPSWPHPELDDVDSAVLRGEQSNTSIILTGLSRERQAVRVIAKIFRTVAAGENPDVMLQGAVAATGSRRVPAMLGSLTATWVDPAGVARRGHVALAQQFLDGSEDAYRVSLRDAAAGRSFADRARALGDATAEVHDLLRRQLPTEPARPDRIEEVIASMHRRLAAAVSEAPALAEHERRITAAFAAARDASWPAFQRIHGDYHLGQVLDVPDRGWVLIDFEGEPLRPLAERNRTDQTVRDVAGMLRSFDYAGASAQTSPSRDTTGNPPVEGAGDGGPAAWVTQAQEAFLDGYAARAGADPRGQRALLLAHLLDKALYEVVYEARNRPTWLPIPLAAVTRLITEVPT